MNSFVLILLPMSQNTFHNKMSHIFPRNRIPSSQIPCLGLIRFFLSKFRIVRFTRSRCQKSRSDNDEMFKPAGFEWCLILGIFKFGFPVGREDVGFEFIFV